MNRLALSASGDSALFMAALDGDVAQGTMKGPLNPTLWTSPLLEALASGGFAEPPAPWEGGQDWQVNLTLMREDLIEEWSDGLWSVGPGSQLEGSYQNGELTTRLDVTGLHIQDIRTGRAGFSLSGGTSALHVELDAEDIQNDQLDVASHLDLYAAVSTGTQSDIVLEWQAPLSGRVTLTHSLESGGRHVVVPRVLSLLHESGPWHLDTTSGGQVQWNGKDWRSIMVNQLALDGPLGRLELNTETTGRTGFPRLTLDMDRIPAHALSTASGAWLDAELPDVAGLLNGQLHTSLYNGNSKAYIQWQDAAVSDHSLGDVCLDLEWRGTLSGTVQQFVEDDKVLEARLVPPQAAKVDMVNWPLTTLNPLLIRGGVDVDGTANGEVYVNWTKGLPVVLGQLNLDIPLLHVQANGGEYSAQGRFRLEPGFMGMDRALVLDPDGHAARVNLSVLHENYAEWNYDVGIDLEETPFQVMNLPAAADRLFYGEVYATGQVDVFGDHHGVEIETALRSEAETHFVLPLDALESTGLPSGIQFINSQSVPPPEEERIPFNVGLSLDLDITPDAEVSLILDGMAGERVDGRTQGTLRLAQTPELPLTVEGGLNIVEGQYRFSLRNLFTKRIEIAPGGRLDWDGDPYAADLNLFAFDRMRANPAPLLPQVVQTNQTSVQVGLAIRGALQAPQLDFDIAFPEYEESDPTMLAEVQAALRTPEAIERQSFALLATGQFIPQESQGGFLSQTAAVQASELISTRLSEWLSGLSQDLDIGLRYRPPAASTSGSSSELESGFGETIELDLGVSLLNDRLRISGNLGTQGFQNPTLGTSGFRGGLDLRYRLTTDGRWELEAYSIPESQLDEDPKQGIGVGYQLRFNRLADLFRSHSTPSSVGQ